MIPTNWDDGVSQWDTPGDYFDRGPAIPFVQIPLGDIATAWNVANSNGDWALIGTQLNAGDELQTSVLISLFSDRVAQPGDVIPDGSTDPRGWVGDLDADFPIGSRLWLLDRAKQTADVLNDAQDYCMEALQWLIADGVAAAINVTAQWVQASMLGIQVNILKMSGNTVSMNFASYWNGVS